MEKEVAICSRIFAQEIPWIEEPGGLQFMGSQELDMTYDLTSTAIFSKNQVLVSFFFSCCFFGLHFIYFCSDHYYIFLLLTLGFVCSSSSFFFFTSFRNKFLQIAYLRVFLFPCVAIIFPYVLLLLPLQILDSSVSIFIDLQGFLKFFLQSFSDPLVVQQHIVQASCACVVSSFVLIFNFKSQCVGRKVA